MNLYEIEKSIGFEVKDFPNIFGQKGPQITGLFNPNAVLNSPVDSQYQDFSKNRLNEFLAGRICALKAINQLTPFDKILPIGKNKGPIWPKGFTGSISHSGNLVSAVVFPDHQLQGIGLDLEFIFDMSTAKDLEKEIILPEERIFLNPNNFLDVVTLIYSAKEAVYKALNVFSDVFLGFEDIKISSLNFSSNIFEAKVNPNISKKILKGRFVFFDSFVSTGVEIHKF